MDKISLNGVWQGKCFAEDHTLDFCFEGTVPGCAHTDLMGKKIPGDLYLRDNADQSLWIENRDFSYSRTFSLEQLPPVARLVFEGLDTYTDIYLNGAHVGSTEDMFIPHVFDVTSLLREGENEISVTFYSAIKRVEGLPLYPGAFTKERMNTRRMQCTYGWDWVARFVTCGIWRDVYLDCTQGFRIKDAYVYTDTAKKEYASIVAEVELEDFQAGGFVDLQVLSPQQEVVYAHRFFVREPMLKTYIDLPNPQLWYPAGYGDQPLYSLVVNGKAFPFGIRTAKVVELPDQPGSPYYEACLAIKDSASGREYDKNEEFSGFQLLINDVPILCRGANWVPSEPFPSAETKEKITCLLELAKEANLNMLRVWGGGIFEQTHFYAECDRLGILVTQDFLMACGHYPEHEEGFLAQVAKEAEFAARTMRNHPSLVWWSGDNENAVLGSDDSEDYWGRTVIYRAIYPTLCRLDPHRRFFLSSPYGGKTYASKTKGTTHNTQYLGVSLFPYLRGDCMQDYKEHLNQYLARFIAEEPTLGAVNLPSLRRFMNERDIYETDDMWAFHTRCDFNLPFTIVEVLHNFTQGVLGKFQNGQDKYFKMKYVQYEWMRVSMENFRRNSGFCNGMVYWMWNDCWPSAAGWALVDYYCLPKASFYSFRRCARHLVSSIDRSADAYRVHLCNDAAQAQTVTLSLSCVQKDAVTPLASLEAVAPAASATVVWSLPLEQLPAGAMLVCDVQIDGVHYDRSFYKNGNLPIVPSDALCVTAQTADSVTVCAKDYVHIVELEGEFVFDDNYFSLLPGESRTVTFRPAENAQSDALAVCGYTVALSQ